MNTKKHQESSSPEQKGQVMTIDAAVHKKKLYELLPFEKKRDSWKPKLNNAMNI